MQRVLANSTRTPGFAAQTTPIASTGMMYLTFIRRDLPRFILLLYDIFFCVSSKKA